ncbi:MAG: hypothetical protein HY043_07270 [Verrucomicrobia bacterium]|nr:hypothetical protein [Verrucomicrobiota bacterium]
MQRTILKSSIVAGLLTCLAGFSAQAAAPAAPTGYANFFTYAGDQRAGIQDGTASSDGSYYPKRMEGPYNGWPGPDPGDDDTSPVDIRDQYNMVLKAYFYPPKDGNIMFAICTDDPGQLYVSTDDNPANKVQLASESQWNPKRGFGGAWDGSVATRRGTVNDGKSPSPRPENWTPYIKVTKGKPYYIESVGTEFGGGDNNAVAFRYEGDPDFADGDKPILGKYLAPFFSPTTATILGQPKDAVAYSGNPVSFSVGVDVGATGTVTSYKWQRNGVDIPNSDSAKLTVTATAADDGAKYKAIIVTSLGTLTTVEATLQVATISNTFSPGVMKWEFYRGADNAGIGGNSIDALTSDPTYPDSPTEIRILGAAEGPNGYAEAYGSRISGFIVPQETADYVFFCSSDDNGALYLSTDDKPANKKQIAAETAWSNGRQWVTSGGSSDLDSKRSDKFPGTEWPSGGKITLTAGKKYYVEMLQKEGGGGDNSAFTMVKASDGDPADGSLTLTGALIGANASPNKGTVTITQQPVFPAQLEEGRSYRFSVNGTVAPAGFNFPLIINWQKDGVNIPGATGTSYVIKAAKASDAGKYQAVLSTASGNSVTSASATLAVVPDTFPPVPTAGAVLNNGKQEVGITFDEQVQPATVGVAGNYSIDKGKIDSVVALTRPTTGFSPDLAAAGFIVPEYNSAKLVVSGLNPGDKATVSVTGVKDLKGNATAAAKASFTAEGSIKWAVVGAAEAGAGFVNDVARVGTDGFDILSGGVAFWSNYDELTMVYEEITGDFDKTVQLVYQDPSSQWARIGLQARESLDIGKGRPDPDNTCPQFILADGTDCLPRAKWFSRLQDVHANATIRWDAGGSNNAYENHYRNDDTYASGTQLNSADGGFGPLDYDNGKVWMRIKREGDTMSVFRSTDGVAWNIMTNKRKFNNLAAKLYVGPYSGPELGNNGAKDGLGHSVLAQFRHYANFDGSPIGSGGGGGGGGTPPKLSVAVTNGKVVITFEGTLQGSDTVNGTFTDVAGATSPFTADTSKAAKFYKAKK